MLDLIREAMRQGRFAVSLHAEQRMRERGITFRQIRNIIMAEDVEIIEIDHRPGRPYPTVLMVGWEQGKPLHLVWAVDEANSRIFLVTVYRPDPDQWESDFKTRKGGRL